MQKEWTKKQNGHVLNTKLAKAFGGTFVFFFNTQTNAKKIQKSHQANAPKHLKQWTDRPRQKEHQLVTAPPM